MKLFIDGKDYYIQFKHQKKNRGGTYDPNFVEKFNGETREVGRKTVAMLWRNFSEENQQIVEYGESFCSLEDQFTKSKGRKTALANLLNKVEPKFSDEERKYIWEVYFENFKKE